MRRPGPGNPSLAPATTLGSHWDLIKLPAHREYTEATLSPQSTSGISMIMIIIGSPQEKHSSTPHAQANAWIKIKIYSFIQYILCNTI